MTDDGLRRRLRRAALRGSLSGALSWSAAKLFGRLSGAPTPSSRTASAVGFAAGASLEFPLLATPTAAAAAAAGLSEEKEDPALGALVGAGFAAASTRVWPLAPVGGAEAPSASTSADECPSPAGEGLYVAVNPKSGNGHSPTDEICKLLPSARVDEIEVKEGSELRKALDEAGEKVGALGVCGGDGSVNAAAQVALDHDAPLMVVPGGTFNHLTQALGIESVEDAVDAVKSGSCVEIDVATIDNHVFLNTASFGSYVELVDAREKLENRIGKWAAIVVALVRVLRKAEPVVVEVDGNEKKIWMAFIGNCCYHPSGFAPSWRERLDDRKLDVRYVDGTEPWSRVRLVGALLTGRLGRSRVYKQQQVEEFRLLSHSGPIRLARDGETFEGSDDVVVRKLPERLRVFAPRKDAE